MQSQAYTVFHYTLHNIYFIKEKSNYFNVFTIRVWILNAMNAFVNVQILTKDYLKKKTNTRQTKFTFTEIFLSL